MPLTGYIEYFILKTLLEPFRECSESCVLRDKRLMDVSWGKYHAELSYLTESSFDIQQYLSQCFRPLSGDIVATSQGPLFHRSQHGWCTVF